MTREYDSRDLTEMYHQAEEAGTLDGVAWYDATSVVEWVGVSGLDHHNDFLADDLADYYAGGTDFDTERMWRE